MNDILQLKGKFNQKSAEQGFGPSNLPRGKCVNVNHLTKLKESLIAVKDYWKTDDFLERPLVDVLYNCIVAKSNRMRAIFPNYKNLDNKIVGAKFSFDRNGNKRHVIKHCVSKEVMNNAIKYIELTIKMMKDNYEDIITDEDISDIYNEKVKINFKDISKTKFINIIVDSYYIEKFDLEREVENFKNNSIISLYETGRSLNDIMSELKIGFYEAKSVDDNTVLLAPEDYKKLKNRAPYLISMGLSDLLEIDSGTVSTINDENLKIPDSIVSPKNEPIIGVIDTMFDENVYFSEWVEFENRVGREIELEYKDYVHGTCVSSIIVDGPRLNPKLDDGCGNFRVKHFGVSKSGTFSSFSIIRSIKEIVEENRDIIVWNLSLGSLLEINENFISPEAALLDKIQHENNVIFVVSGTNKDKKGNPERIGAPADSINSLVVNAVDFNDKSCDYSRRGEVLSFFNKPDISYYGGNSKNPLIACSPQGRKFVSGTSYAAPWISRKIAYLIEVLGFSREVAKALIIDSCTNWDKTTFDSRYMGYGVVPININDIIHSPDDEIKFIISGVSKKYDTYTFDLPVPEHKEKQPFVAKATMCYFPKCSRNQGVDYTNTEMDIHFGRLRLINKNKKNERISINTINDNKQADEELVKMYEKTARKLYRKWDNVKHIRENINTEKGNRKQTKKKMENPMWGISIKTKARLDTNDGKGLHFGLVITLKEINGVNRIEEFIRQCSFRGWIVNRIDVDNLNKIYIKGEETVHFE